MRNKWNRWLVKLRHTVLSTVLSIVLTVGGTVYAAESGNAGGGDEALPNLFDSTVLDQVHIEEDNARPGTFVCNEDTFTEYFYIDGITRDFTYSGHVKILDIGEEQWTGVRLMIGNDLAGHDLLLITKVWGIRFEFKKDNLGDKVWDNTKIRLSPDVEFDFKVVYKGNNVTLYINDMEEGSLDIPEEFDAFDEENDCNLGIAAAKCKFELSNVVITCPDVKVADAKTPEPTDNATPDNGTEATPGTESSNPATTTATATPTPGTQSSTPGTTTATQSAVTKQTPTNAPSSGDDTDSSMLPYILAAVAAAVVVVVVVVIVIKKKKSR